MPNLLTGTWASNLQKTFVGGYFNIGGEKIGAWPSSFLSSTICSDASNNIYLCYSDSTTNISYVKFNSLGIIQIYNTYTISIGVSANGIKVDASGNAYIFGKTTDYNSFVMKVNSSGVFQWAKSFKYGTNNSDDCLTLEIDSSGNVYFVGYNLTVISGSTVYRAILVKINSSGTHQFTVQLEPTNISGEAMFEGIMVASDGFIYIWGHQYTTAGYLNAVLAKYNSSGTRQWWQVITQESTTDSTIDGLTVDSSSNVYVSYTTAAGNVSRIIKLNSSGSLQWGRQLNTLPATSISGSTVSSTQYGSTMLTIDSSNNIYYSYNLSPNFGVIKLDTSGSIIAQYSLGSFDAVNAPIYFQPYMLNSTTLPVSWVNGANAKAAVLPTSFTPSSPVWISGVSYTGIGPVSPLTVTGSTTAPTLTNPGWTWNTNTPTTNNHTSSTAVNTIGGYLGNKWQLS